MLTRLDDFSEAEWILAGRRPLTREAFPPVEDEAPLPTHFIYFH